MVTPVQGDIYWVRFGRSGDSGPSGKRPAVIVQSNLLNRTNIQTTVVTLLTSNLKLARIPGNIRLNKGAANLPKASVVVVSQMASVDKTRLLEKIGTLNQEKLTEVVDGCRQVISLNILD
ncbi:MAG: type II toxin-antitoxin system PemK/MazF family toxin [bacterium]|nr:type II toxin-antitoxin system PemK/MazF family toxin [bacterium]